MEEEDEEEEEEERGESELSWRISEESLTEMDFFFLRPWKRG